MVGGGWAGCAAALAARRFGAAVTLFERSDMLLGTGLVGGIMRNNGRDTAAEEMMALGGGDLFRLADGAARHTGVDFPGHRHATLYDVHQAEPAVAAHLVAAGITVRRETRVVGVEGGGRRIDAVAWRGVDGEGKVAAAAFVDATGTAGPPGNCSRFGNGCVMCAIRCPTFGPRINIAGELGVAELHAEGPGGAVGAMSGSCELARESLAPKLLRELDGRGVAVIPLPAELRRQMSLSGKVCQQYALPEYRDSLVLLDTGAIKLMSSYFPLTLLRRVPGCERARFTDPCAGGRGNSMRMLSFAPHNEALQVDGIDNLFCCGEKTGPLVGHTEAIASGTLAGHNAARQAAGERLLRLPETLACGDIIAWLTSRLREPGGLSVRYTFSGSVYFERMQALGLYTTDRAAIARRVADAGLSGVFAGRDDVWR